MSSDTKWLKIRQQVIGNQRGICYEADCDIHGLEVIAISNTQWAAFCRRHRLQRQRDQIQTRRAETQAARSAQAEFAFGLEPDIHKT